jgi:hypothetical protein
MNFSKPLPSLQKLRKVLAVIGHPAEMSDAEEVLWLIKHASPTFGQRLPPGSKRKHYRKKMDEELRVFARMKKEVKLQRTHRPGSRFSQTKLDFFQGNQKEKSENQNKENRDEENPTCETPNKFTKCKTPGMRLQTRRTLPSPKVASTEPQTTKKKQMTKKKPTPPTPPTPRVMLSEPTASTKTPRRIYNWSESESDEETHLSPVLRSPSPPNSWDEWYMHEKDFHSQPNPYKSNS